MDSDLLSSLNVVIFVILFLIFVTSSIVLLNPVKKILISYRREHVSKGLGFFYSTINVSQILTFSLVLLIIIQMLILNQYSLVFLRIQTYVSHLSGLLFLSFLVFTFTRWLTLKKNYATALYTISFSLICIDLIISLMYLDFYFSGSPLPEIGPYPMVSYVTNLVHSTSTTDSLSIIFDVLSLTSFLLMWAL